MKYKILIIEDELDWLKEIQIGLRKKGFSALDLLENDYQEIKDFLSDQNKHNQRTLQAALRGLMIDVFIIDCKLWYSQYDGVVLYNNIILQDSILNKSKVVFISNYVLQDEVIINSKTSYIMKMDTARGKDYDNTIIRIVVEIEKLMNNRDNSLTDWVNKHI